jgi:hypothetical protein
MGLFSHCRPMDVELGVGVDKDIALIILNIQYSMDSKVQTWEFIRITRNKNNHDNIDAARVSRIIKNTSH